MRDIQRESSRRGDMIAFTAAFLRSQPAETLGKVLNHMEGELVEFMGRNIGFQDVSRIAFYRTMANYAAENTGLFRGDQAQEKKAASVAAEYGQTIQDLQISESLRGEYRNIQHTYDRIAKELKPKSP
jgi:hypothetical protein